MSNVVELYLGGGRFELHLDHMYIEIMVAVQSLLEHFQILRYFSNLIKHQHVPRTETSRRRKWTVLKVQSLRLLDKYNPVCLPRL